jgi:hypothetical protein
MGTYGPYEFKFKRERLDIRKGGLLIEMFTVCENGHHIFQYGYYRGYLTSCHECHISNKRRCFLGNKRALCCSLQLEGICSICKEESSPGLCLREEEFYLIFPCGHYGHKACFGEYTQRCPVCPIEDYGYLEYCRICCELEQEGNLRTGVCDRCTVTFQRCNICQEPLSEPRLAKLSIHCGNCSFENSSAWKRFYWDQVFHELLETQPRQE